MFLNQCQRRLYSDLAHSYSKTLQLPKTKFPKRSSLDKATKDLIPRSSQLLYKKQFEQRPTTDDIFIFHDGPPYANGDLHLGHALNKVLKDIVNRYQLLLGKKVFYKPGWDCHGLPIELKALEKVNAKLKKDSSTVLPVKEIRKIARQHALKTIDKQLEGFKSLAILTDFEDKYTTLSHDFEIRQLKVFQKLLSKNWIKRQKKPVYWGCETHTALAESELEYNDQHRSTAAFIKFPIVEPSKSLSQILHQHNITNLNALIWTSTPWTIPSNRAISTNESFEYTIIKSQTNESLLVSQNLSDQILKLNEDYKPTDILINGGDLLGSFYHNPITPDLKSPIIHGDHVTNIAGTGLVHTAPGHGNDDYFVCLKHGIEAYSPVDQFGKYTDELLPGFKSLIGLKVIPEGNNQVLQILQESGLIYHIDRSYIHSYPYDWRSKKPVIIRATPQWFANVGEIKENAIKALDDVQFIPERGSTRLHSFIQNRNEWCISRQRSWGVPIPALYSKTDENVVLMDQDSVTHIINKIDELGTDAWFEIEEDVERWLPESHRGQGSNFTKGKDTMDVWFDSGSSWTGIAKFVEDNKLERDYLADIYLEGSDQHRGWFQSSLLTKIGTSDEKTPKAPYKTIVTHGFTLDEKGLKMSKSIGNIITPDAIIKGNAQTPGVGVDGLRLWVAQADYTSDISIGPNILKHVGDALKKLRITFTFLLGNLEKFEERDVVKYQDLKKIDQYALSRLSLVNEEALKHYQQYNFGRALKTITNHLNIESSAIYFDIVKDRLYTDSVDGLSRKSAQTVLSKILQTYATLLAPIVPVITQEVWDYAPSWITGSSTNPLLNGAVDLKEFRNVQLENQFDDLWTIKDTVKLLLEEGRQSKNIKSSLEADVYIKTPSGGKIDKLLKEFESELSDLYLVSHVRVNEEVPEAEFNYNKSISVIGETLEISVLPSSHSKCPRCWKFTSESTTSLCGRCEEVVGSLS